MESQPHFLWKVSLKMLNSGIILKTFIHALDSKSAGKSVHRHAKAFTAPNMHVDEGSKPKSWTQ